MRSRNLIESIYGFFDFFSLSNQLSVGKNLCAFGCLMRKQKKTHTYTQDSHLFVSIDEFDYQFKMPLCYASNGSTCAHMFLFASSPNLRENHNQFFSLLFMNFVAIFSISQRKWDLSLTLISWKHVREEKKKTTKTRHCEMTIFVKRILWIPLLFGEQMR